MSNKKQNKLFEIQPAVKTETIKVAKWEALGVALMFIVFLVLHLFWPDSIPFDYKVILAGIIGGAVAVFNFLLMGISVQNLTNAPDEETGKSMFKASYRKRMLMQIVWGVLALALPCFNGIAGLVPLIIPTFAIRMDGILAALGIKTNKANATFSEETSEETPEENSEENSKENPEENSEETLRADSIETKKGDD